MFSKAISGQYTKFRDMLENGEIGKHSDVPVFRFNVYIDELICVHLSMKTCFADAFVSLKT